MLEWLKRHAWKACSRLKRLTGSNPVLSAKEIQRKKSSPLELFSLYLFCTAPPQAKFLSEPEQAPYSSKK